MLSMEAFVQGAAAAAPAKDSHHRINDQIALADAARRAGRTADAAKLYADAYHMTTGLADYRASEVALDLALLSAALYREAFEASDGDHALCERSRDLLRTAAADWELAGHAVPQAILDELRWTEDRLAQAPQPAEAEPVLEAKPEPVPAPGTAPPDPSPSPGALAPSTASAATEPPRRGKGLGIALVAGGATSTIAGAVLVALGAPLRARAWAYRADTLQSPEFARWGPADQAIIEDHLDRYVAAEQRRGVALMASGGAVLGVGVVAVVVGGLRLARGRRPRGPGATSHRIVPRASFGLGTTMVGFSLSL